MHKQIQIAPGVYVTDFRKDGKLIGLGQNEKKELTNDVGLLLDQVQDLQTKINQLLYSIKQIKGEENWEADADFTEAVEENWEHIVKFSYEMKQKVLRLYQLKYQPESEKIEELLKIHRIEQRQNEAIEEVKKNITKLTKRDEEARKLAKVQGSDEEEQNAKKPSQQNDKGVFI